MKMQFEDRTEAGQRLAEELLAYADRTDVLVLALPRGGVPVAFEVAQRLHAPMDVFVVRKLGVPGHEELAMGALAAGGARILNRDVLDQLYISEQVLNLITIRERRELERRERAYRGERPPLQIEGRAVILIDDGIATGSTMHAAVAALRELKPARIIVAVPAAAPMIHQEFEKEADEFVAVMTPWPFHGVGEWYKDFSQTSDEEVRALLDRAWQEQAAPVYSHD
jgi:predicted phosphoribosyltransferase